MPRCSRPPVPDTCLQPVLPATVEFDSAAAALRIFHTKSLERKSLVTPAQRVQPPFPLDSFACTPSIAPPPLPPGAATTGTRPARRPAPGAPARTHGGSGTCTGWRNPRQRGHGPVAPGVGRVHSRVVRMLVHRRWGQAQADPSCPAPSARTRGSIQRNHSGGASASTNIAA